jgi:hypothetical protein
MHAAKHDPLEALVAGSNLVDPNLQAMMAFQDWLIGLRNTGLATVDRRVVSLNPQIAKRFRLAIAARRFFVGMAPGETEWAEQMPWSHAAHHRGEPRLYLVCDKVEVDGNQCDRFALEIEVQDSRQLAILRTLDQIDLRRIDGPQVSAQPFVTLPLWLLEAGQWVLAEGAEAVKPKRVAAA